MVDGREKRLHEVAIEWARGDVAELVYGDGCGTANGTQFVVGIFDARHGILHERDRICFHAAHQCRMVRRASPDGSVDRD